MVTKNTENNANNALNILPESASTAVDNDEKYLSFALVLAITIMDNLVKLIGTDGFVLYTYTLQDTATARAVFNELARRLKNFNRQEEVYTTDYLTFRMKYIYGVTLFEHDGKSILNLFDKKGYPVLSESGEPGSLDDMYLDIQARLHGGYASKKFLHLHEHCLLSAHVTPSVEKTQRGILIKAGRNLVSFIHADDESRKTDIFKSVVNVIKS
ncbi:hypothetical protein [Escherichia coli]|uniref:hypothetical protein n=1 Tax=Escherichia coli TaxID=562 RepID=UPI000BE1A16C|nr:hypothetical protein [Escherichia coli]EFE6986062.1 hypothetical protein [Escherichia coli]